MPQPASWTRSTRLDRQLSQQRRPFRARSATSKTGRRHGRHRSQHLQPCCRHSRRSRAHGPGRSPRPRCPLLRPPPPPRRALQLVCHQRQAHQRRCRQAVRSTTAAASRSSARPTRRRFKLLTATPCWPNNSSRRPSARTGRSGPAVASGRWATTSAASRASRGRLARSQRWTRGGPGNSRRTTTWPRDSALCVTLSRAGVTLRPRRPTSRPTTSTATGKRSTRLAIPRRQTGKTVLRTSAVRRSSRSPVARVRPSPVQTRVPTARRSRHRRGQRRRLLGSRLRTLLRPHWMIPTSGRCVARSPPSSRRRRVARAGRLLRRRHWRSAKTSGMPVSGCTGWSPRPRCCARWVSQLGRGQRISKR
jgi:hypothetical protein